MAKVWPVLDLGMQAEGVPAPVVRWGSRARGLARGSGPRLWLGYRFEAPGKANGLSPGIGSGIESRAVAS
jgi:hypothetical protein